jgi:polyisoprenoid-binding protein YceI
MMFLNKVGLTLIFSLVSIGVFAQNWNLNKDKSSVAFKIRNMGMTVDGVFHDFKAEANFDSENVEKGKISGEIKVASIDTDIKKRDQHLLEEEYFHEQKFPTITFKSTKLKKIGGNRIAVDGVITIRGIEKKVSFEAEFAGNDKVIVFIFSLDLNRRDFGVGGKSWVLSDDLTAHLKIAMTR